MVFLDIDSDSDKWLSFMNPLQVGYNGEVFFFLQWQQNEYEYHVEEKDTVSKSTDFTQ